MFRFGTTVVEVTESGAVPVAMFEISWVPVTVPVKVEFPVDPIMERIVPCLPLYT